MRKTALTFTVTTLVLGVFGAFLRWLQLMNAFDKETGFPVPGAGVTTVLIVYCVLALAAFCVLTLLWLGRYDRAKTAETALKCTTAAPLIISWALCAAFAAAACIILFTAGTSQTPLLQRLFGAFGILAALSIPFLFGKNGGSGAGAVLIYGDFHVALLNKFQIPAKWSVGDPAYYGCFWNPWPQAGYEDRWK